MTIFIFQVSSESDRRAWLGRTACGTAVGSAGSLSVRIVLWGRLSPPWKRLPPPSRPPPASLPSTQAGDASV